MIVKYCVILELKSKELEFEAMKKQAESTNEEYDRLSSEFQKLQVGLCLRSFTVKYIESSLTVVSPHLSERFSNTEPSSFKKVVQIRETTVF